MRTAHAQRTHPSIHVHVDTFFTGNIYIFANLWYPASLACEQLDWSDAESQQIARHIIGFNRLLFVIAEQEKKGDIRKVR